MFESLRCERTPGSSIVWLGRAGGIIDSVNTDLVPNAGNTIKMVEHITTVVKANTSHPRRLSSEGKLLRFELVVELPIASESLQFTTLSNPNGRSNRKLFLICHHRERAI
jgi:hypothetical protein